MIEAELETSLANFPAVAVLGPRQCGKSTLARQLATQRASTYLDLERPADLARLGEPELYLESLLSRKDHLVCLDEVQRLPDLFPVLRSLIDRFSRPGQFLILGSASPGLLRQSSESLAGRIAYHDLCPFLLPEIESIETDPKTAERHIWVRGGFPPSALAPSEELSMQWRENFIRTFLERDLAQLGSRIDPASLGRLWRMLAHEQGQILNRSRLGSSLGVSHTTIQNWLTMLEKTFMLRILPPAGTNLGKRMRKSPRVFVRDTGILHAMLGIDSFDELLGHPVFGPSWESLVIEHACAVLPRWSAAYYRTSHGAELDLVLHKGTRRVALECKASKAPRLSRGFHEAVEDVRPDHAWIVAPVDEPYPLAQGVTVTNLRGCLANLSKFGG